MTTALCTVLNGLLSTYIGVPIAVLRPFNGSHTAALQAGIAACEAPALVRWIDTAGFFNTRCGADLLKLHPTADNNLNIIGPRIAAALKPILYVANRRP